MKTEYLLSKNQTRSGNWEYYLNRRKENEEEWTCIAEGPIALAISTRCKNIKVETTTNNSYSRSVGL